MDWAKCARFSLFGSLYVAPTLYAWVRISSRIWPKTNFRTALTKAVVEQTTYGPFAIVSFFSIMTYAETKSIALAKEEVLDKFLPTYKVCALIFLNFV